MEKTRKTDRRTLYTRQVLKDALLDLTKDNAFEKISVKQVCERADVSRATFYLHYNNLNELLDEIIDDALLFSESASGNAIDLIDIINSSHIQALRENESVLPACQRIADSARYHDLFMDPSLSEYIIMKIFNHEKETVVPAIQKKADIDRDTAEMIFRFMLHGSFYVNKSLDWEKNERWYNFQRTLSAFLETGLRALSTKR